MLPPTDQGHLRKYLTTLGVAIVVASIAIGGFILQTQNDLLVDQAKINQASPTGRAVIEKKQHIIQTVVDWAPVVLGGLVVLGVFLAVYGLLGWSKRQKVLDKKDSVDLEKVQAELDDLRASKQTREQERERAVDEVLESSGQDAEKVAESGDGLPRETDSEPPKLPSTADLNSKDSDRGADRLQVPASSVSPRAFSRDDVRRDIGAVEAEASQKLSAIFGEANVVNGAQVVSRSDQPAEARIYLDAVAVDRATKQGFAIELKVQRRVVTSNLYSGFVQCVLGAVQLEERGLHGAANFKPVLIVVLHDEGVTPNRLTNLKGRIAMIARLFIKTPKVLIYTREEFASLSPNQLLYDLN